MLIEEFVDFRIRAGETVRMEREREHLRRAEERRGWLRRAASRVSPVASKPVAAVPAVAPVRPVTQAQAAVEPAHEPITRPAAELAHAAR
jgi:hypothetical protein